MPDIAAGNMGNSILNLIYGQQNDPAQQMSDLADTMKARNRVAIGTDLQGNLLPAPPPGTPPGVGSGQITGPPQDPTAAMQQIQQNGMLTPGQTPNAYKSEPSMGSLVIALQRQQEAAAGLQQSIGLGMSAFARPENRERVFKSFAPQAPMDPTKLGDSIMNMTMQTQGQDRMNALGQMIMDPQRGPAIATQLNIGWDELKARFQADPGATGQMIQQFLTPTDDLKNLQGIQRMQGGGTGGGSNPTLGDVSSQIIGRVAGQQSAPMMTAQAAWRTAHPGQPDSQMPWKTNDLQSFGTFQANEAQKTEARGKASDVLFNNQPKAEDLMSDVTTLRDSPGLKTILADPVKREFLRNALANPTGFSVPDILGRYQFTPAEQQAVALLGKINGGVYSEALHSLVGTGTRVTQQEAGPLASSVSSSKEVNMDYPDYVKQNLNPLITRAKRAIATGYGASGNFNGMDSTYAPWVHSIFKPGGELFKEGSGAENLPATQPIPASEIALAKAHLAKQPNGKEDVLDNWQQRGFDTSHLRTIPPTDW